jgi:hypothetical protein
MGRQPVGMDELFEHWTVLDDVLELGFYDWIGRTIEYHRAQIRDPLGFRVCGVADAEKLTPAAKSD